MICKEVVKEVEKVKEKIFLKSQETENSLTTLGRILCFTVIIPQWFYSMRRHSWNCLGLSSPRQKAKQDLSELPPALEVTYTFSPQRPELYVKFL